MNVQNCKICLFEYLWFSCLSYFYANFFKNLKFLFLVVVLILIMSNDIHGLKKSVKFSSEPDTGSNSFDKTSNGAIAKLPQKRFYRQR